MNKYLVLSIAFLISGCVSLTGYKDTDSEVFYERKTELEIQCKSEAQNLNPGYPAKRGVLTNYWFTRSYDQCLEKKTLN